MNLGERIKAARIRARLSQRALARQLGISAMAVCKYERGEIRPHPNVLNRMAEILKVDTDFFFRSPSVRVVQMLFSEEETISQAMESELRVYLEEELGRWLELEQLRKTRPSPRFPSPKRFPIRTEEGAEETAVALRRAWDLGMDPIHSVVGVLEDQGVRVIEWEYSVPAGWGVLDNGEIVLGIQRGADSLTVRWEVARLVGGWFAIETTDPLKARVRERFARSFLVPQEVAQRELEQGGEDLSPEEFMILQDKYGLRADQWIIRAMELGKIDQEKVRELMRAVQRLRQENPTREFSFLERPQRARRLGCLPSQGADRKRKRPFSSPAGSSLPSNASPSSSQPAGWMHTPVGEEGMFLD